MARLSDYQHQWSRGGVKSASPTHASSTQWPSLSMAGRARLWAGERPPKHCVNQYLRYSILALRRLLEPKLAALIRVVDHPLPFSTGLRVIKAMSSACVTRSAIVRTPNAQPTTLRLNTSVTAARYKKTA